VRDSSYFEHFDFRVRSIHSLLKLIGTSDRFRGCLPGLAAGEYRNKTEDEIRGSGYVVNSLEAALWCFHKTDTFRDAVLKAVNLGDDADTTAAVCGQVAGAFYGESGIPDEWLDKLCMRDRITEFANQLSAGGVRRKNRYSPARGYVCFPRLRGGPKSGGLSGFSERPGNSLSRLLSFSPLSISQASTVKRSTVSGKDENGTVQNSSVSAPRRMPSRFKEAEHQRTKGVSGCNDFGMTAQSSSLMTISMTPFSPFTGP
jgi:hypothetical protein